MDSFSGLSSGLPGARRVAPSISHSSLISICHHAMPFPTNRDVEAEDDRRNQASVGYHEAIYVQPSKSFPAIENANRISKQKCRFSSLVSGGFWDYNIVALSFLSRMTKLLFGNKDTRTFWKSLLVDFVRSGRSEDGVVWFGGGTFVIVVLKNNSACHRTRWSFAEDAHQEGRSGTRHGD